MKKETSIEKQISLGKEQSDSRIIRGITINLSEPDQYEKECEKIEEIVEWLFQNGYTVSESKRFFEAAQTMIESAAPVKKIRVAVENYLPSKVIREELQTIRSSMELKMDKEELSRRIQERLKESC